MRMSLSSKLYAVIALLILLTVIIVGFAFYNIDRLADIADTTGLQGKRSIAVAIMDRVALERQMTMNTIVRSDDETAMQSLLDGRMKDTETAMAQQMQIFEANLPAIPTQAQREYVPTLKRLWGAYVDATARVANLSIENSNEKAARISGQLQSAFDSLDTDLNQLADTIIEHAHPSEGAVARGLRAYMALFRLNLEQFINADTPAERKEKQDIALGYVQRIDGQLDEFSKSLLPEDGGTKSGEIFQFLQREVTPNVLQIVELVNRDSNGLATQLYQAEGVPAFAALDAFTNNLLNTAITQMDNYASQTFAMRRTVMIVMSIVSAVGIILGIIMGVITVRSITSKLNQIISGLSESSTQVHAAANQISQSSQGLAEGSTEQAASLEETSSALEEMASMTRQNADNATKTDQTTQNNNRLIATGSTAVGNMTSAMSEINDSAEQISRIIKTIEEIAFNTNLLALNAAVEAARAGEAGKGFAVVADEVRNLAGRSAQAAKDTTHLIQTTIERVRNGSDIASELHSSFGEIEEGSNAVARLITEITSATNEQAQGVDQVNTAVAQMDKVTQSNAATAEEAASAAEELTAQAGALSTMVDDLVALVEGKVGKSGAAGGASASAGHHSPRQAPPRRVMQVKEVEHVRRAPGSAPASAKKDTVKMLPASEVIPLGEDDEF